ncbi:MAG: DUF4922 domain-containing protein [Phycisphaerae bacterium]|jgi:hypothetical protein
MSVPGRVAFAGSTADQMAALWAAQSRGWGRLADGLAALRRARARALDLNGATLLLQSNPARLVSTGAKIDAASVAARPCFLCPAHLPPEQQALCYHGRPDSASSAGDDRGGRADEDGWLILCNPAPIFEPHFVLTYTRHEPQRAAPVLALMLNLARDLQGAYTTFYNGPLCGASAPDHLHVQAVPSGLLPFERELIAALDAGANPPAGTAVPATLASGSPGQPEKGVRPMPLDWLRIGPVRIGVTTPPYRSAVVLVGADATTMLAAIREVLSTIGAIHPAEPEPMVNLLATCRDGEWLVTVFPRVKHRPAAYGHGADQFLVSPGCLDLGGVLIVPRSEDFDRITPGLAAAFLNEVLLPPSELARLARAIRG